MTLNDIAISHQSDKGSQGHDYANLYQLLFRGMEVNGILELGVFYGYSLKVWAEYFPLAYIVGVDSRDWGYTTTDSRICLLYGDAYTQEMLDKARGCYDIIIDDASHALDDQTWAIQYYSQLLSPNGIMLIEDVQHREDIPLLVNAVPEGFGYSVVEMPRGQPTSRLFILWRR